MPSNDLLNQVEIKRPKPKKEKKSSQTSIAERMTSANNSTHVFSLRVTEDELLEMNQLAEQLKAHSRAGHRNNLLRACFQAMKGKDLKHLLKLINSLP